MSLYSSPSSITMQRAGDRPVTITLEDAVVIMTNQQKTIEDLIANNQKMFQFIQQAQNSGGFGNIQFAQQNLADPASHIYNNMSAASNSNFNQTPVREKPMTLNEYLAKKKSEQASKTTPSTLSSMPTNTTSSTTSTTAAPTTQPMSLSEFLALKKSNASTKEDDVPVFDTPSKI